MAKRIASNFSAIKNLYNQVSAAMPCECPDSMLPQMERLKSSLNAIESKLLIEHEFEKEEPKEKRPNCIIEDTDFRKLELQSCPCVYQHTKDIAEKRKEVDNPPCPCLLNSKRKLDTCPCLMNSKYERKLLFFSHQFFELNILCYFTYARSSRSYDKRSFRSSNFDGS